MLLYQISLYRVSTVIMIDNDNNNSNDSNSNNNNNNNDNDVNNDLSFSIRRDLAQPSGDVRTSWPQIPEANRAQASPHRLQHAGRMAVQTQVQRCRTRYCISCYFREGFIFANFASQTLAKISTSIHVYL